MKFSLVLCLVLLALVRPGACKFSEKTLKRMDMVGMAADGIAMVLDKVWDHLDSDMGLSDGLKQIEAMKGYPVPRVRFNEDVTP